MANIFKKSLYKSYKPNSVKKSLNIKRQRREKFIWYYYEAMLKKIYIINFYITPLCDLLITSIKPINMIQFRSLINRLNKLTEQRISHIGE